MAVLERCLHQVFRESKPVDTRAVFGENGMGDCSVCNYDPKNNGHCSHYTPILFYVVEVVAEEKSS